MTESLSLQIVAENEGEALIAAQAIAYYRAVKQAGKAAPYGQFFNHAEKATLDEGRNFMRNTLQQIAQEEIDEVEKRRQTADSRRQFAADASGVITFLCCLLPSVICRLLTRWAFEVLLFVRALAVPLKSAGKT